MRVLHINSYYYVSSFYKNLYDKQFENGLEIDVFVPTFYSNDIKKENFGEYTLISENFSKLDRYFFFIKQKKIFCDLLKKYNKNLEKFSVVHAHSLFSNGHIAYKFKKKYDVPYVVAVRNTDLNLFFKKFFFLKPLGLKILKEAKAVIFLSKGYKDELIEDHVPKKFKDYISEKSIIIPNGIDDFWQKNLGKPKKKPFKASIKLLYVGVINKNKNLTTTVKAIEILKSKGFEVIFSVVGAVEDKKVFGEITKKKFVNYISPQPKEKLLEIYRKHDVFVMPSKKETFGLVYGEAISQGLPVLYTKWQGFDSQFENGKVGYRVSPLNPSEIANKIILICENYEAFSLRCINSAKKFDWVIINKRYKNLYFCSKP